MMNDTDTRPGEGAGAGTDKPGEGTQDAQHPSDGAVMDQDVEREQLRRSEMHAMIAEVADHEHWRGSCMDAKGDRIGLRAIANNFQRKLYGTPANTVEVVKAMQSMEANMILATEPGPGTKTNTVMFNNTLANYQCSAVTMNRDDSTIGGGMALILDEAWTKVPHTTKVYDPQKREMRGRVMAVTFDNRVPGMHNKLLVIGVHAPNRAEQKEEDMTKMMQWIQRQKGEFELANPLATVMLLGDLNAAVNTYLDTNRQEFELREPDEDEEEADAFVLRELYNMKLVDVFRGRYPSTRAVTRVSEIQTNRLLDRILVTAEAAAHPATEVGIYKDQLILAGSDHLMMMIDLPIDTAGMARDRVKLWEKRIVTKWVSDSDTLGYMAPWKIAAFHEKLATRAAPEGFKEYTGWIRDAAEGTVLRSVTHTYPKRASTKQLYSPTDHKIRANLRTLRYMHRRNMDGDDPRRSAVLARRRLRVVADTAMTKPTIQKVVTACKHSQKGNQSGVIQNLIKELELYLSKKRRKERSEQVRHSVKTRDERFKDKGKLMLKMVINSLMRRHREKEEITVVEGKKDRAYGEDEVKAVVREFYFEWMESRVKVEERFESWDDMLEIDTDKLTHPEHKEFVELAYSESRQKFKALQDTEGIWDALRRRPELQEVRTALKAMKKGTAPGPSGNTYDLLGMLKDEHLGPLVNIVAATIATGTVEQEMNRSLLRPLAKTDQGLADLGKTRPIALMEAILKITERVIFTRVMIVINEHDMLRCEQHGSLANRSAKAPIRALAEMIEDALMSGKELHVLSADISKAFDSIEYWSQAMGWSALGMPKDLIEMLVNMDKEGETAVILGQGRTTDWYKNGRGVRQGSIGGPIKWVIFMNFWIEYVYKAAAGSGYRMSEAEPTDMETLGQIFVDDSNWFAADSEAMTLLVKLGEDFTGFHGLSFNKKKCEYMAVNQPMGEGNRYDQPKWKDGTPLPAKMRAEKGGATHRTAKNWEAALRDQALEVDDVTIHSQPTEDDYQAIGDRTAAWESAIHELDEDASKLAERKLVKTVTEIRERVYGAGEGEMREATQRWATNLGKAMTLNGAMRTGEGQATRYLGVMYELNTSWRTQRAVLNKKFRAMQEGIGASRPTKEQAIYCVNAVINAAMRYPLQVAHMPKSQLRAWDAANRAVVRKAGSLPTQIGELLHEPRERGGAGLQSLEQGVTQARATDQITWLNTPGVTGQIVRAAYKRWSKTGKEPGTLQQRSMEAVARLGGKITEEESTMCDPWGRPHTTVRFSGKAAQLELDVFEARSMPRQQSKLHAFGDGATHAEQDRAGWGMTVVRETTECLTGRVIREEILTREGRIAGKQSNDAAETEAILMALLHTHPDDDLVIYCDNQGCVDVWNKIMVEGTVGINSQNRALWHRIWGLADHRKGTGKQAQMRWVHSHVDDEARRTDVTRAKYQCACGKQGECTVPGERGHWIHEGNERADGLAERGSTRPKPGAERTRAGELRFIIHSASNPTNMAQGRYKTWVADMGQDVAKGEDGTARHRVGEARDRSHEKSYRTLMKTLHSEGPPTWRFWSRLSLGCLPTHSQMSKFARSSPEGAYATVYRDTIGEEGTCVRCGHDKETTEHAITACPRARQWWERLQHSLEEKWREAGEDWRQHDWIEAKVGEYEGWHPMRAAEGLIPKDIGDRLCMQDPKICKLVNETAKAAVSTAFEVWEARNESVLEWLELNPELKERKKHADRTGWRSGTKRKAKRPRADRAEEEDETLGAQRTRTKRIREWVAEEAAAAEARVEGAVARAVAKYEYDCAAGKVLKGSTARMEAEKKAAAKEAMSEHGAWARGVKAKAAKAGSTRDIKSDELGPTTMHETQPAVSTEKRTHHWVPAVGTLVEALWTAPEGEKHGNLKGQWWPGKVTALTWPETKGIPGAEITYTDGHVEWHGMDSCAITVRTRLIRGRRAAMKSTVFPEAASGWLGIGARLAVQWPGVGYRVGSVMGTDKHGIIVRYLCGSTAAHTDLHKRGCQIREFRRQVDQREYYGAREWLQCPYGGDEEDCECVPCGRKWQRVYRERGLDVDAQTKVMAVTPEDRMAAIDEWEMSRARPDPPEPQRGEQSEQEAQSRPTERQQRDMEAVRRSSRGTEPAKKRAATERGERPKAKGTAKRTGTQGDEAPPKRPARRAAPAAATPPPPTATLREHAGRGKRKQPQEPSGDARKGRPLARPPTTEPPREPTPTAATRPPTALRRRNATRGEDHRAGSEAAVTGDGPRKSKRKQSPDTAEGARKGRPLTGPPSLSEVEAHARAVGEPGEQRTAWGKRPSRAEGDTGDQVMGPPRGPPTARRVGAQQGPGGQGDQQVRQGAGPPVGLPTAAGGRRRRPVSEMGMTGAGAAGEEQQGRKRRETGLGEAGGDGYHDPGD
jgi:ribonuclease HI/exonuclease III